MDVTDIDILLATWIAGEANLPETAAVEKWMAVDITNQNYANSLRALWEQSQQPVLDAAVDEQAALLKLRQRIAAAADYSAPATVGNGKHFIYNKFRWLSAAAVLVFVATIGIVLYRYSQDPIKQGKGSNASNERDLRNEQNIATYNAGTAVLPDTLPDGTIVLLQPRARLSYAAGFNRRDRNTALSGSAFFTVAHDSVKLFRIAVKDVSVTVRGTAFNIIDTTGLIKVVVATGVVEVRGRQQRMMLHAHDSLLIAVNQSWIKNTDTIPSAAVKKTMKAKPASNIVKTNMDGDDYLRQLATMKAILQELVTYKVVKDFNSIHWVGLSETELMVNGIKQPSTIQQALSKKYLRVAGEGYYYGPVKMHGKGYFFDRGDIKR